MSRRRRRHRGGATALPALLMVASPFLFMHYASMADRRPAAADPRLPEGLAWADFRPAARAGTPEDRPVPSRRPANAEFGWMEAMVGPVDRTPRLSEAKEGISIECQEALVDALVRMATGGGARERSYEQAPRDTWTRGGGSWASGMGAARPAGEPEGLSSQLVDRALADPAVGELLQRVVARKGRVQEERWR